MHKNIAAIVVRLKINFYFCVDYATKILTNLITNL